METRIYPLVLAAIFEGKVRPKLIRSEEEYTAFLVRFDKPGTEFREVKTLDATYKKYTGKRLPGSEDWLYQ
jgi:hypothetical protein